MKKILQKIIIIMLLVLTVFNTFSPVIYVYASTEEYEKAKELYEEEIQNRINIVIDIWLENRTIRDLSESDLEVLALYIESNCIEYGKNYSLPTELYEYEVCWLQVKDVLDKSEKEQLKEYINNDYIINFNVRAFIRERKAREGQEIGYITLEDAKRLLNDLINEQVLIGEGPWDQKVEGLAEAIDEFKVKRANLPNDRK